jgi:hypothetical protein
MKNEFFIRYANNLFKDDPKNLELIIHDIAEQLRIMNKVSRTKSFNELVLVRLESIVKAIGLFSNCKDFNLALKIKDKRKSEAQLELDRKGINQSFSHDLEIAFNAVFFQKYGFCEGTWYENGSCTGYRSDKHDFGLDENYRIKCHECRQLVFRSMLTDYVKNNGFQQIAYKRGDSLGLIDETWFDEHFPEANAVVLSDYDNKLSFDYYLSRAYDCVETKVFSLNNNIVKFEHFAMTNLFDGQRSIYPQDMRFNNFLISVVSYSLVEFLMKNNFKKLKICPFCNNFFIAGNIRRTRCYSKECENAYQREKKRKQRQNDPVKYV